MADVGYQSQEQILGSRPRSKSWNLVLVSEGYTKGQLDDYVGLAKRFAKELSTTAPFGDLVDRIVVTRLDYASEEDEASVNGGCDEPAVVRKTFFRSSFCNEGLLRLMAVDDDLVRAEVTAHVPEWQTILVFVNSSRFAGGRGGDLSGVTLVSMRDGPQSFPQAIHELGHTVGGLADEYEYFEGCNLGEKGHDVYAGPEFVEPNVTKGQDAQLYPDEPHNVRWGSLVNAKLVPTMENPDLQGTRCDTRSDLGKPKGSVGLYDGARYFHKDAFRPVHNCRMRAAAQPFCPICQDAITKALAPYA